MKLGVLVSFINLLAHGASKKTLLVWRNSIMHLIWLRGCNIIGLTNLGGNNSIIFRTYFYSYILFVAIV